MLTEFVNHVNVIKNFQDLPQNCIQNYDFFPRVQIQSQIRIFNLSRSGFEEKGLKLEQSITAVRHVTGNDQDYLRKIPRAVVQISALL
jgi:hypothetical protein